MNDELIVVAKETALEAFSKPDGLQCIVDEARDLVNSFEHDTSTASGRKKTASLARRVSTLKVRLDGYGKDLVTEWKKKSGAVDVNRKSMRDQLEGIRDIAREPLTKWEEAEAKRIDGIKERIFSITHLSYDKDVFAREYTVNEMLENLRAIESTVIDTSFQEFAGEASIAKDKACMDLKESINKRHKHEAEQAELERLRQEEAARKQKTYEANLKKEAAKAAKLKAEKKAQKEKDALKRETQEALDREAKAIQDKKDAEQETIAAEERAKVEKEQAAENARLKEIKRQEDEEAEVKAEQEKREDDEKHVDAVTKAAVKYIMHHGPVSEENAANIVFAIKNNQIPNVRIEF